MSTIFNFDSGFRRTEFMLDRAYMLAESQLKIRALRDVNAMNARHQDEVVRSQRSVTSFTSDKLNAGEAVGDLKRALDRILDIRNALFAARAGAAQGDRAAFDNSLFDVNRRAQDASQDSSNLIGWLGVDGNGTRSRTVELGANSFNILSHSLGATYAIELEDGTRLRPEFRNNEVELNGERHGVTGIRYVSEADGMITFAVGDGEDEQQFTGRVVKGGVGVGSSWTYGNLSNQEFRDLAVADVNAALQRVNAVERELNATLIQAEFQYNRAKSQTDAAQAKVDNIIREQISEQKAMERAIEARTQIALIVMSLGAQQRLTEIDAIFRPDPPITNTILDTFGLFD